MASAKNGAKRICGRVRAPRIKPIPKCAGRGLDCGALLREQARQINRAPLPAG